MLVLSRYVLRLVGAREEADSRKQVLKFIKSKLKVDPRAPGVMGHLDSLIRENLVLADGVLTLKD